MTTADAVSSLVSPVPEHHTRIRATIRRRAQLLLLELDAEVDELADRLHRAEATLRRHGLL